MDSNKNLSKPQLTLLLSKYLRNYQNKGCELGLVDYSHSKFIYKLCELFQKDLFNKDLLDEYENLQQYYIHLIVVEANIKLRKIAKLLFEEKGMLNQSSISNLVKSEFINENQAVSILVQLISNINKFFEQKSSKNIKEMAWMVYDEYGYLSIEDLIVFQYLCKKRHFANKYQHVNVKGVNAEYLLIWLEAYNDLRKELQSDIYKSFREDNEQLIGESSTLLIEFCDRLKVARTKKQRLDKKYDRLKEQYLSQDKNRPIWTKFIEFIAYKELRFQRAYFFNTNAEIEVKAKEQALQFLADWKTGFEQELWQEVRQSKDALPKEKAMRNYCISQIKYYLFQGKKNSREIDAYSLLMEEFNFIIESQSINTATQFVRAIYPISSFKRGDDFNLNIVKQQLVYKLIKQFNKLYECHYKDRLEADKLPCSEKEFVKLQVINWINITVPHFYQ